MPQQIRFIGENKGASIEVQPSVNEKPDGFVTILSENNAEKIGVTLSKEDAKDFIREIQRVLKQIN